VYLYSPRLNKNKRLGEIGGERERERERERARDGGGGKTEKACRVIE
jgi:hypothetical protein